MLVAIHPKDPEPRIIQRALDVLRSGGVIVCPTDTVYAYVCDSAQHRGIQRIAKLKGVRPKKAELSLICHDLSQLSLYTRALPTPVFRMMKRALPGPYTFILPASNEIPKLFDANRRTVGIRVPDNAIARSLAEGLGHALASASVHDPDRLPDHTTDPERIHEQLAVQVDLVLDAGAGGTIGSTVIDATGDVPVVVRQGLGAVDELF
jgi:tRNA threonylcarbamoyl adenosine modification protein (Sua5/YciO/YrdC/YwlC family)